MLTYQYLPVKPTKGKKQIQTQKPNTKKNPNQPQTPKPKDIAFSVVSIIFP